MAERPKLSEAFSAEVGQDIASAITDSLRDSFQFEGGNQRPSDIRLSVQNGLTQFFTAFHNRETKIEQNVINQASRPSQNKEVQELVALTKQELMPKDVGNGSLDDIMSQDNQKKLASSWSRAINPTVNQKSTPYQATDRQSGSMTPNGAENQDKDFVDFLISEDAQRISKCAHQHRVDSVLDNEFSAWNPPAAREEQSETNNDDNNSRTGNQSVVPTGFYSLASKMIVDSFTDEELSDAPAFFQNWFSRLGLSKPPSKGTFSSSSPSSSTLSSTASSDSKMKDDKNPISDENASSIMDKKSEQFSKCATKYMGALSQMLQNTSKTLSKQDVTRSSLTEVPLDSKPTFDQQQLNVEDMASFIDGAWEELDMTEIILKVDEIVPGFLSILEAKLSEKQREEEGDGTSWLQTLLQETLSEAKARNSVSTSGDCSQNNSKEKSVNLQQPSSDINASTVDFGNKACKDIISHFFPDATEFQKDASSELLSEILPDVLKSLQEVLQKEPETTEAQEPDTPKAQESDTTHTATEETGFDFSALLSSILQPSSDNDASTENVGSEFYQDLLSNFIPDATEVPNSGEFSKTPTTQGLGNVLGDLFSSMVSSSDNNASTENVGNQFYQDLLSNLIPDAAGVPNSSIVSKTPSTQGVLGNVLGDLFSSVVNAVKDVNIQKEQQNEGSESETQNTKPSIHTEIAEEILSNPARISEILSNASKYVNELQNLLQNSAPVSTRSQNDSAEATNVMLDTFTNLISQSNVASSFAQMSENRKDARTEERNEETADEEDEEQQEQDYPKPDFKSVLEGALKDTINNSFCQPWRPQIQKILPRPVIQEKAKELEDMKTPIDDFIHDKHREQQVAPGIPHPRNAPRLDNLRYGRDILYASGTGQAILEDERYNRKYPKDNWPSKPPGFRNEDERTIASRSSAKKQQPTDEPYGDDVTVVKAGRVTVKIQGAEKVQVNKGLEMVVDDVLD